MTQPDIRTVTITPAAVNEVLAKAVPARVRERLDSAKESVANLLVTGNATSTATAGLMAIAIIKVALIQLDYELIGDPEEFITIHDRDVSHLVTYARSFMPEQDIKLLRDLDPVAYVQMANHWNPDPEHPVDATNLYEEVG